jgi:hypothetical protein
MPFDSTEIPVSPEVALLRRAQRMIRHPATWWQGGWCDDAEVPHAVCMLTAIQVAAGNSSKRTVVEKRAARMLARHLPATWVGYLLTARANLVGFNDDPQTTHAMVMDLFDRTIEFETCLETVA